MKKKVFSILLTLVLVLTFTTPALASNFHDSAWKLNVHVTPQPGIIGTILYQDNTSSSPSSATLTSPASTTVSYTENSDGSVTVYQYEGSRLIEEHTATPGSGIVYHKIYLNDGSSISTSEITRDAPIARNILHSRSANGCPERCPDSVLATGSATFPLGYMHYRHSISGTIYSIYCDAISEQHLGQYFTFGQHTAKTLSDWVSTILSWAPIIKNPAGLAASMILFAQDKGILSAIINNKITALVTERMFCDFYNQEIHGTSTSHSGYPHVVLDGTYAFVTIDGETVVKSEGYTVRSWGNSSMGRWMIYTMFGIDEAPTSWTGID